MAMYGPPLSARKFPPPRDFSSLSVRDLLDARDAYHVHLAHLDNVVATAIGRYRFRKGDRYDRFAPGDPEAEKAPKLDDERTLFDSVVKPWSVPCVLVFVSKWVPRHGFADDPDQAVPGALYLPDGRVVPTCVVSVSKIDAPAAGEPSLSFPDSFIGGGYLISSDVQGKEHFGTVGCLVTDGSMMYALTNRHVTGEKGREIFSYFRGRRERVGVSDGNQIGKLPFEEVYPGWAGSYAMTNMDAGLLRVDKVSRWTSKVVGLPPLGIPIDLNTDSMTLDLIGCPVQAFGGMSGALHGTIEALFYRYKSIGGTDYVADMLIAPSGETNTLPGDSGTLWCVESRVDNVTTYRPVALEWGGHAIVDDSGSKTVARGFALATCISTICRELDVDVVRDVNAQLPEYWSDVGHYTIAARACAEVTTPKLKKLMTENRLNISYDDPDIDPDKFSFQRGHFVPLADVPDKVWKGFGWKGQRGAPEHPAHHADVDHELHGKTLLQLCAEDPNNVNLTFWREFYDEVGVGITTDEYGKEHDGRGILPFRVWQIFDDMVASVRERKLDRFVAGAGVLSHYVSDACQPLHLSKDFDGGARAEGVHERFEKDILNQNCVELLQRLKVKPKAGKPVRDVVDGESAAKHVVAMMVDVFGKLSPDDIIDSFIDSSVDGRHYSKLMWDDIGDKVVEVMALGTKTLAELWESAWAAGDGNTAFRESEIVRIDRPKLRALYQDTGFVRSHDIESIGEELGVEEPVGA